MSVSWSWGTIENYEAVARAAKSYLEGIHGHGVWVPLDEIKARRHALEDALAKVGMAVQPNTTVGA